MNKIQFRVLRGSILPTAATARHVREIQSRRLAGDVITVPISILCGNMIVRPSNSLGPEFVPLDVLSASVDLWILQPIVYNHPSTSTGSAKYPSVLSSSQLGVIGNPRMYGNSLVVDATLSISLVQSRGDQAILDSIETGGNIEVSIGAFVKIMKQYGLYAGQSYEFIWQQIVEADHLAILKPGHVGACSNVSGCGLYFDSVALSQLNCTCSMCACLACLDQASNTSDGGSKHMCGTTTICSDGIDVTILSPKRPDPWGIVDHSQRRAAAYDAPDPWRLGNLWKER
jgi:hypothetical protein